MTHGLLISGEAGIGKWSLAWSLAAALLCENSDAGVKPCGKCKACMEVAALTHPDLIVLRKGEHLDPSAEAKTVIPVDDIKAMIGMVSLQGFQGNKHIVIIRHAEDMNQAAQNKLLKTLEEPPEGTHFLLTCVNADQLLPTIVSRCRPLKMHPWGDREVMRVLTENGIDSARALQAVLDAGGSFGKGLRIAGDEEYWHFREEVIQDFLGGSSRSGILKVSTKWKDRKDEAEAIFTVLDQCFSRMAHQRLGLGSSGAALPPPWEKFSQRAELSDFIKLNEALTLARKRVRSQVQFQTVIEQLILTLMEAVDK